MVIPVNTIFEIVDLLKTRFSVVERDIKLFKHKFGLNTFAICHKPAASGPAALPVAGSSGMPESGNRPRASIQGIS